MHHFGFIVLGLSVFVASSTDAKAQLSHDTELLAWSLSGHAALALTTTSLPSGEATVTYRVIGPRAQRSFTTSSIVAKAEGVKQTINDARCSRTLSALSRHLEQTGFRGLTLGQTCGVNRQPVSVSEQERLKVSGSWLEGAGTFLKDRRPHRCGEQTCVSRVELMNNTLFISEGDKVIMTLEDIPQTKKLSAARADSGLLLLIRHHWGAGNTALLGAFRSKTGETSALKRLRL